MSVCASAVPLDRDAFLRTLLRELSAVLEDVVGLPEAAGFVSVVGQNMAIKLTPITGPLFVWTNSTAARWPKLWWI
jgi:hypothetical protein